MNKNHFKQLFGPSLSALFLAGCMVGPKYHQPAATVLPPPAVPVAPTLFLRVAEDWERRKDGAVLRVG